VWFLTMRYIPGGPTLQSLMNGPMQPPEVARIVAQVASALDALHARGIIHRDIKPPNILMDGPDPVVSEFGIAQVPGSTGPGPEGMAIGTPAYVAPEQAMGKRALPASDQYALAVVVYQMLSARLPFSGDSLSLVMQHVRKTALPITRANRALTSGIAEVVARALSKGPLDRYPTCGEFAAALSAAILNPTPGEENRIDGTWSGWAEGEPGDSLAQRVFQGTAAMRRLVRRLIDRGAT
jgi:serine/threonine protein kinase